MPDERDYPSYSRDPLSYVLFLKCLGGSLFFCGAAVSITTGVAIAPGFALRLSVPIILAFILVSVYYLLVDSLFGRMAKSRVAAWLYPLIAYAFVISGSFIVYPLGVVIQSIGVWFCYLLWILSFQTKKRVIVPAGITFVLTGFMLIAFQWLSLNNLAPADSRIISSALVFLSGIIYFALPISRRMNMRLLSVDKRTSLERLPSRHNKSMRRFGVLRGILIGYSLYTLLSSLPDDPNDAMLWVGASSLCLIVQLVQLFLSYESHAEGIPQKQIELFSSSLFLILALVALTPFAKGVFSFILGLLVLIYALRRSIHRLDFENHWSFLFSASPIVSQANSLISAFFGIILGWGLALAPAYYTVTFFEGALSGNHLASLLILVLLTIVVSFETTKRLANCQDEVKNLIGEIAVRDKAAEKYEEFTNAEASVLSGQSKQSGIPFSTAPTPPPAMVQNSSTPGDQRSRYHVFAERLELTARQAEVLLYLLKGRNAAYICNQLFISPATARSHIQSIYKKAGVHSQQELMETFDTFCGR